MQAQVLEVKQDAQDRMDEEFLDDKGYIKLLPSEVFLKEDRTQLRIWCGRHAIYGITTTELIDWLRQFIDDPIDAIEIGAGNGRLGAYLGIRSTDSYMQCDPSIKAYYESIGQTVTEPPTDVLRHEASDAIAAFQPKVVIASWLTQRFIKGIDKEGMAQSSVYGADEVDLLRQVKCYVHIGNENSHGEKRILKKPHLTFKFPWLVSRAAYSERNVIYVWG